MMFIIQVFGSKAAFIIIKIPIFLIFYQGIVSSCGHSGLIVNERYCFTMITQAMIPYCLLAIFRDGKWYTTNRTDDAISIVHQFCCFAICNGCVIDTMWQRCAPAGWVYVNSERRILLHKGNLSGR